MLKEKVSFRREDAVLLTVDLTSPYMEGYAMAFLKLFNNAREYPDVLYKVFNQRESNLVFVICNMKHLERVKAFCTGMHICMDDKGCPVYIGKVINEQKVSIGIPTYDYDSTYHYDTEEWDHDIDQAVDYWVDMQE